MKREHSYITALAILCCLLLWSLFSGYEIKKKEPVKEIVIEVKHDTVIDTKKVVVLEKKVNQLKRKLKKVTWAQDSLKAECIRKDGLLKDTASFIRLEFTEPFTYLMNKQ